jgi:cell division septum initiation protein DivIVA
MSDRLKELQRQRALAQEQIAWFDREIARETNGKVTASPTGVPVANPAEAKAAAAEIEAQKILERFRHTEHPVRDEVKRGCFIYFFAAFGLLILALMGFYFARRHS